LRKTIESIAFQIGGRAACVRLHITCLLLAALFAAAIALPARAQIGGPAPKTNVFVTSVNSDAYPHVDAQIYATDATGLPVANLQNTDLTVAVDGVEVNPDEFSLAPTSNGAQSMVIVLDTTTSAASWGGVVASAQNLLAALQPGDAAALVTFGDAVQVQSTLSADIQQTRDALASVASIAPQGTASAVNQAILDALSLYAAGEAQEPEIAGNRRSIVLLTERAGDGDNPPAEQPDGATVLQFAQQQGVALQLYAWGVAAAAAQDLLDLAANSGGRFTPLATAGDANAHFQALPALLRPGYLLSLLLDLPANNDNHVLLVAGAESQPVERTFTASARPLEITITRPAEGDTVTGNAIVAVSVGAPAPIAQMNFMLESGEVITSTEGPVGGILWDTSALSAGEQSIIVQAVDTVGNVGQSSRNVTVRAPIILQVESSAESVQVGEPAYVTATVDSAFDGVMVEAFLGRTQVGVTANPVGPVHFAIDTSEFAPGRYALVVRASNSGGYSVANDENVISLSPAPAQPSPAQETFAAALLWLNQWWHLLLLGLLGLLLLWWLIAAILRTARRRKATSAARALQVHPQMRMLLTNSGNVRTRYRLRAQALEGEYKFTFIHNGMALVAPAVEHVMATNGHASNGQASNGRVVQSAQVASAPAYAPKPAAQGSANSAQVVATTAAVGENAAKTASFLQRFFGTAGDLIPGAVGDAMGKAEGTMRSAQTTTAMTTHKVSEVSGNAQEMATMSKSVGATANKAAGGGQVPSAVQPATPANYRPQSAASNAAFALQPARGANGTGTRSGGASQPRWVETPPVAPGDTIGVDLFVQPAQGRAKNKRVQLRLFAVPTEVEGVQPSVDEVSILLR